MGKMMRPTRFVVAALLIASPAGARPHKAPPPSAPVSAPPAVATSPAVTEAQTRFRRALELYQEGNLDAARTEFRRAYEIAPSFKVLYNLGQIEFELQNYPAALSAFTRYLTEGGEQIPEARKTQVEKDIEKLHARVATIDLKVNVEGAQIAVDDVALGTAPLTTPLLVSAGRRKISVSHPGYVSETRNLDLGGGDRSAVEISLQEVAPASAALTMPVPMAHAETTPSPSRQQRSIPWAGWSVTTLLAASAGVTGGLALSTSQKLRQDRGQLGADRGELDHRQRQVNALALASDLCTGAAVIVGGISLYLTVAGGRRGDDRESVRLVPGPGSVSVTGAF